MNVALYTRRSILATAALGGISLFGPRPAMAFEPEDGVLEFFAFPELSESDVDLLVRMQAEKEAERIIQEAAQLEAPAVRAARGRPSYSTVYGSVQIRNSGWHDVAGQPPGGVHIEGGGEIHVQPSGGGSVSVSVPLPGGVGSIGVSIPLARRGYSATGYAVPISGPGFYKATANIMNKVQPFVVYETVNGVKRVYRKTAINRFFRMSLDKRRVG